METDPHTTNVIVYLLILAASLMLVGFFKRRKDIMKIDDDIEFTEKYLQNFQSYCGYAGLLNSNSDEVKSREPLNYLIQNACQMQDMLGKLGILQNYQAPYSNVIHSQYQIIMNAPREIDRLVFDSPRFHLSSELESAVMYARATQDSLQMFYGNLISNANYLRKNFWNPLISIKDGIYFVIINILSPIAITGVVSANLMERIGNFFAGLIFLCIILGIPIKAIFDYFSELNKFLEFMK